MRTVSPDQDDVRKMDGTAKIGPFNIGWQLADDGTLFVLVFEERDGVYWLLSEGTFRPNASVEVVQEITEDLADQLWDN